jgi:hypothetical protein
MSARLLSHRRRILGYLERRTGEQYDPQHAFILLGGVALFSP